MDVDYITMDIKTVGNKATIGVANLHVQVKALVQRADLEERRAESFHKPLKLIETDLRKLRGYVAPAILYQLDAALEIIEEALYS